ncbi:MAG: hypothetical protein AB7P33_02685 [Dehalococcoidia bacterium]
MARTQTGLLIIRAWVEPGSTEPLRAHIRLTTGTQPGLESEATLAGIPSVVAAVELWLRDVLVTENAA